MYPVLSKLPKISILMVISTSLGLLACSDVDTPEMERGVVTINSDYHLTQIASGLKYPWGLVVLEDGNMLVSERDGHIRMIDSRGNVSMPLYGTPEAYVDRQGGYLDLAAHPDFAINRYIYLAFSEGNGQANRTALWRAKLNMAGDGFEDGEVIFRSTPDRATSLHYGARMIFMNDGSLLLGLGDGYRYMAQAQNAENHIGTVVRMRDNGLIPDDNPFVTFKAGDHFVYSYGHRNVQGLAYDSVNEIVYAAEHGPKGGDEINILKAGANYGWPEITYGLNYDGTIISPKTHTEGMEQPFVRYVPSIAPGALLYYSGDKYPDLTHGLLITALVGQKIQHLAIEGGEIVAQTDMLDREKLRFRDIVQGPQGYIYVTSDASNGGIFRLEVENMR